MGKLLKGKNYWILLCFLFLVTSECGFPLFLYLWNLNNLIYNYCQKKVIAQQKQIRTNKKKRKLCILKKRRYAVLRPRLYPGPTHSFISMGRVGPPMPPAVMWWEA